MSKNVITATPEDSVQNIYTRIMETGFSAFPVLKKKQLVGVISRRDLISSRAVRSALTGHTHRTIADIMNNDVVTISPHDPAQVAATAGHARCKPVTGDGRWQSPGYRRPA